MAFSNMDSMIKFDNEVGTPNKPPRFFCNNDYSSWKLRFESFILYNDPDLWTHITERYIQPRVEGSFSGEAPFKPIKKLTVEERKEFDQEKKAFAAITMCLPKDVLSCFKNQTTSYDLWEALAKRFGGNDQLKKSRKDLLKKQFDLFDIMKNESFDELISRFSQLICELKEVGVTYDNLEINEKFLDALPSNWEMRVLLLKENEELSTWE